MVPPPRNIVPVSLAASYSLVKARSQLGEGFGRHDVAEHDETVVFEAIAERPHSICLNLMHRHQLALESLAAVRRVPSLDRADDTTR